MPYHRALDGVQESSRGSAQKVGTTGRGIGPCYQDKMGRTGIRASDLRYPSLLEEKVKRGCKYATALSAALGGSGVFDPDQVLRELNGLRSFCPGPGTPQRFSTIPWTKGERSCSKVLRERFWTLIGAHTLM
jgi:adenylosuccinate synthase